MDSEAPTQALRALSQFLVSERSIGETLLEVSRITADAVPAAEMAGITMLGEHGKPTTAVFTDPEAPEIDIAQYESGAGPCLDAWRERRVVRIDDMALDGGRYPAFAKTAAIHGVESVLSLPLVALSNGLGALNLYARRPRCFTGDDETLGMELASAAAVVLANTSAYWAANELGEQLSQAIRSRAVIEQAKGILMARSPGLDADRAFDLLRKASQRENMKLRDIAQRIVDRNGLPPGAPEPP